MKSDEENVIQAHWQEYAEAAGIDTSMPWAAMMRMAFAAAWRVQARRLSAAT